MRGSACVCKHISTEICTSARRKGKSMFFFIKIAFDRRICRTLSLL